jgi:hypothetical protein
LDGRSGLVRRWKSVGRDAKKARQFDLGAEHQVLEEVNKPLEAYVRVSTEF